MFNFAKKDEPVQIRFLFDRATARKRMTWDDLETFEMIREGEQSMRRLKALAARFMTDAHGEYLPNDKALKILGALSAEDIADVLQKFTAAMQEAALPNTSAPASNLPSEAGAETTPPPGL